MALWAYTKFDRFLDGEFHFFAAGHHLAQMDMQRGFTVINFAALYFNQNIFLTGLDNNRLEDLIAAVKSSIAWPLPIRKRDRHGWPRRRKSYLATRGNAFRVMDARNAHA